MKLLLFGGTFDPPHIGHMSLLQNAVAAVLPDKVVVVPAGVPPHKSVSATPAGIRLAMCECFRPVFPTLEISDIEVLREGKSYTIDTVHTFRDHFPDASLFLSIGGDMLLTFTAWRRYQELLQLTTLVVQGRSLDAAVLEEAAKGLAAEGGRVLFTQGETVELSSSDIRAGLAAGQNLWPLIPPPADFIAKQYKLYTS